MTCTFCEEPATRKALELVVWVGHPPISGEHDVCDGCGEALDFEYGLFVKETGITPRPIPSEGDIPKDFIMVQKVGPANEYKVAKWRDRSLALERLLGEKIRVGGKMRFVVCKDPLPGLKPKAKSASKPIEYMWPVDHVAKSSGIDFTWYTESIVEYVYSAFGFDRQGSSMSPATLGLDAWM